MRMQEKIFKKCLKKLFSVNKKIVSPLHPPYTRAMAAKNITSPEGFFYPCLQYTEIFSPPTVKKAVPMCGLDI